MTPLPPIFYLEDHADTREFVTLVLLQKGYEVCSVGTLEEAQVVLKSASADAFSLYLLDAKIEGHSSVDLCHAINSIHSRAPIVFLSAGMREIDQEKALQCGAVEILLKPISNQTLLEAVYKLAGRPRRLEYP